MEAVEIKNFSKYLARSREMGRKAGVGLAFAVAFFIGGLYLSYAYGFWLGGIYIENRYQNHILGRNYMGGDILCVFWGVIFGFFALSSLSPQFKALIEGRVAGKSAYDVINRKPEIEVDAGENHEIKGAIKFENVSFYYPTRTD